MSLLFEKWQGHAKLQFATLSVLVASFCVIAGVLTVSHNLSKILTLWGESLQVSVYMNEAASPESVTSVEKMLSENKNVDKIKYVTKDQALGQFRDQMASYAPDLLNDSDLLRFIPSSFQFSLNKNVAPAEHLQIMQGLAGSLKVQPGVDEVSYGQDWIKSYSSITQGLNYVGAFFIGIIFISAGFVMSNSINTSVQQKRAEIEVLELIGATSRQIRKPFVIEGAVVAGVSSVIALALTWGLFSSTKNALKDQISFLQLNEHLEFIGAGQTISVFSLAVLLGAFASWLCVRRINTGWSASQKSKDGREKA